MTKEEIAILSSTFPDDVISIKPQAFSKDKTKVMLVQYIQHTECYKRLETVDPGWGCAVIRAEVVGSLHIVHMRLVLKGVGRENVGEGEDYKSAYSDAIKRCAMLFGVGRYLYDSEQVWRPYNENTDKYKTWTIEDYRGTSKNNPSSYKNQVEQQKVASQQGQTASQSPNGPIVEDKVFTIGKMTGKKFSELVGDLRFKEWVNVILDKNYAEAHQELKDFHKYARSQGAYR